MQKAETGYFNHTTPQHELKTIVHIVQSTRTTQYQYPITKHVIHFLSQPENRRILLMIQFHLSSSGPSKHPIWSKQSKNTLY